MLTRLRFLPAHLELFAFEEGAWTLTRVRDRLPVGNRVHFSVLCEMTTIPPSSALNRENVRYTLTKTQHLEKLCAANTIS